MIDRAMYIVLTIILTVIAGLPAYAQSPVQMSVLPSARSGTPNEPLTFLTTILNSGEVELTCQTQFGGFFPGAQGGQARYFPFDGTNITGTANQPVTIPAAGRQDYVVEITVPNAFSGPLFSNIRCTGDGGIQATVPRLRLVNDFNVNIQAGNPPDIIMIGDTLSNDGVARIAETGPRAALMTLAAVNIGGPATDFIVVPEVTGFSTLQAGYRPTICETDSAGLCIGPEDTIVRVADWPTDEVRFFAVRLRVPPQNGVPSYPDQLRLRVRTAPEPDTSGLDRPADFAGDWNQLLDAMFGGYSSGVEAKAQPPFDDIIAPVQQCVTQVNGDTGGEFARSGGFLLVSQEQGSGGPVEMDGFLEFADGQFQTGVIDFFRPVQLEFPSDSAAGTASIAGGGTGTVQETDRDFPVVLVAQNGDRGVRIHWEAQGGGLVDIAQAGSARCAGAPAPAIATDPATADGFDAAVNAFGNGTSQTFNVGPGSPFTGQVTVNDFGDFIASSATASDEFVAYGAIAFPQDTPGLTAGQNAANRAGSATAFTGVVAPRGQPGPAAVFMPQSYVVTDGDVSISCGVFAYPGTVDTNNGPNGDSDGGVARLINEDPAEFGDGECIQ